MTAALAPSDTSGRDKSGVLRAPAQWRDLLTHSVSTISVESNDSNLSSGYLARKRSQDSSQSAQDGGEIPIYCIPFIIFKYLT